MTKIPKYTFAFMVRSHIKVNAPHTMTSVAIASFTDIVEGPFHFWLSETNHLLGKVSSLFIRHLILKELNDSPLPLMKLIMEQKVNLE